MCSLLALLDLRSDPEELRDRALALSIRQRHRGPDWSGVWSSDRAILVHERLAIVGVEGGAQPLVDQAGRCVLAVNGEIYNHAELEEGLAEAPPLRSGSDCEVLLPLWLERGAGFLPELNGIFAFVLHDSAEDRWLIARDHLGIVPLYWGRDECDTLHVASELKALTPVCGEVHEFPPGHLWESGEPGPRRWYDRRWMHRMPRETDPVEGAGPRPPGPPAPSDPSPPREGAPSRRIRRALEAAVHRQLMSDVPYGALLSGGLDSSVIAAIAARFAARRVEDGDRTPAWWPRLHTFAIGLDDSPDLERAEEVAAHIGSVHHGFTYQLQEGLDALRDVIWHLETFDVTTIRAGTPMFLLARRIRSMGVKMVLSGEGADEIFGGYLYFHQAPSPEAFHQETVRKLSRLHQYDCLRANKAMAAWGVEARVPFLDPTFLDVAMTLDPAAKMVAGDRLEKQLLRDAFADLLPGSIVRRQKEQFSDGVGYDWIDGLRSHAEARVTDRDLATAAERFPLHPPTTKEGLLYRRIFEELFPPSTAELVPGGPSVACSTPEALAWDPRLAEVTDPSGRAVRGVHREAY